MRKLARTSLRTRSNTHALTPLQELAQGGTAANTLVSSTLDMGREMFVEPWKEMGQARKGFRLCSSRPALSWRTRAGLAGVCGGGQAAGTARSCSGRVGGSRAHSAAQRGRASPPFRSAGGPQHPLGGWAVAGG